MPAEFPIPSPEAKAPEPGKELIANLKAAAEANDKAKIIEALTVIQKKINTAWGDENEPMNKPFYDDGQRRYRFSLSTGTAGTRFFFDTENINSNVFPGKLIFPGVNMDHDINGKTLDKAFEEVFGSAAKNISTNPEGNSPYYVVDVIDVKGSDKKNRNN